MDPDETANNCKPFSPQGRRGSKKRGKRVNILFSVLNPKE
jgi:hypothetical protein